MLNSAPADSENNLGGSSETYVLHRTGCSQEDDQFLREGRSWSCVPGRQDRFNPVRTGRVDRDVAPTPDDRHGSDDLYRVDLRSSASACREGEGSTSADAAGHRGSQAEERHDRLPQDRRLPALRPAAGVPYGLDRDPGPPTHTALPEPGAEAGGADEEPGLRPFDGDRCELQQAAAAPDGLLRRADVDQRRGQREHPPAAPGFAANTSTGRSG